MESELRRNMPLALTTRANGIEVVGIILQGRYRRVTFLKLWGDLYVEQEGDLPMIGIRAAIAEAMEEEARIAIEARFAAFEAAMARNAALMRDYDEWDDDEWDDDEWDDVPEWKINGF